MDWNSAGGIPEVLEPPPSRRTVPHQLEYWAGARPDAPFIRCGGEWLSFAEAERSATAFAGSLARRGIGKGDPVAIVLPNCSEMLIAILGLARLGAIQVPINTFLKGEFLRYQLDDSQAVALITDPAGADELDRLRSSLPSLRTVILVGDEGDAHADVGFGELLAAADPAPPVELVPSDVMSVIYTSGTTGFPKGCICSHGYYLSLMRPWYKSGWYRFDDRIITATPMFHMSGQGVALMGALLGGLSVSYEQSFSASNFIDRAREADATVAYGVGPMAMAMLASEPRPTDQAHRLRLAVFMPLAPQGQEAFEERFKVRVASEVYGQSECIGVTMSPLEKPRRTSGCIGRPVELFEVKVVDDDDHEVAVEEVGELVVRPVEPLALFSGYWRKPEATVEAFRNLWHHTGDYVRQHPDGYLTFVDRKKDAIRRRGENISSIELEAAIGKHPNVSAVAVHGVPSPLGEEDVKAWIVLAPGETLEPQQLHEYFKDNLPYFAVPRYVQITDALPTNAVGRVQKFELRSRDNDGAWDFEALGLEVARPRRR